MASRGYHYYDGVRKMKKGWRARVKVREREYFLGSFPTKREAEQVEYDFKYGGKDATK